MQFKERRGVADESKSVQFTCPVPLPAKDTVLLGHGSGGKLTADLIRDSQTFGRGQGDRP